MMKRICRLFFLIIAFCLFINVASATISISGDTTVISEQAFYGDASITDVVLPEGLLRIEKQAFAYTSLSSVALPFSLEYFAPDAFEGCPESLMLRVYPGSDALRLCLEYQIPHEIIGSTSAAVGISMPTKDLQRWAQDGENMENKLRDSGFEVELQYADNDCPTQLNQIETMIDHGCKVIVIAPIDGHLLGTALAKAKAKGIKIIAYDRLLMDSDAVDYYVTFDNYMVGTIQGTYVKEELDLNNAFGSFCMEITAGDPGDNNARSFYQGAIDVLKPFIEAGKIIVRSGQTEFNQVATPTWQTNVAQKRAEDILNEYYADGEQLDAWLCSNDSTALGVTNALDNYTGGGWPIITGQDCDIVNVKNIIAGKQSMSVFKDTRTLAAQAVKMITQILAGGEVEVNDTETYNNNVINVPSFLCAPVYVDAGNYKELLIDSGYYTEDQLGGGSSIP